MQHGSPLPVCRLSVLPLQHARRQHAWAPTPRQPNTVGTSPKHRAPGEDSRGRLLLNHLSSQDQDVAKM